jgi:hypothetical protein
MFPAVGNVFGGKLRRFARESIERPDGQSPATSQECFTLCLEIVR